MDLKELQKIAPKEGRSTFIYDEVTRLRWHEGYTQRELTHEEQEAVRTDKTYTIGELLLATAAYASAQGLDLDGCLAVALEIDSEGLDVVEEVDGEQADE